MKDLKVKEPVDLDEMSDDLHMIQSKQDMESSIPYIAIQLGDCKVSIPADVSIIKDMCRKIGLQNRTLFNVGDSIRVGIDIKKEK
jgi:hypothetical protein